MPSDKSPLKRDLEDDLDTGDQLAAKKIKISPSGFDIFFNLPVSNNSHDLTYFFSSAISELRGELNYYLTMKNYNKLSLNLV